MATRDIESPDRTDLKAVDHERFFEAMYVPPLPAVEQRRGHFSDARGFGPPTELAKLLFVQWTCGIRFAPGYPTVTAPSSFFKSFDTSASMMLKVTYFQRAERVVHVTEDLKRRDREAAASLVEFRRPYRCISRSHAKGAGSRIRDCVPADVTLPGVAERVRTIQRRNF